MSYTPENPTSSIPEDTQAWLAREFGAISGDLNRSNKAGFASMRRDTPLTVTRAVGATPEKIDEFDVKVSPEVEAYADLANSSMLLRSPGIWLVSASLVFKVDPSSANDTREMEVRLFNETDAVVVTILASDSIPRYGEQVSLAATIPVVVTEGIRKDFILQGYTTSGHTVNINEFSLMKFTVVRVSP